MSMGICEFFPNARSAIALTMARSATFLAPFSKGSCQIASPAPRLSLRTSPQTGAAIPPASGLPPPGAPSEIIPLILCKTDKKPPKSPDCHFVHKETSPTHLFAANHTPRNRPSSPVSNRDCRIFPNQFRHFGYFYLDTVPDVVYDAKCDHKPFHCYLTYKELRRSFELSYAIFIQLLSYL